MDVTGAIIGLLNVFLGVVVIGIAYPLAKGKVAMNRTYGVRVRQSFESEEKWYKINRYGGRKLMIWGAIIAVIGVAAMFIDVGSRWELTTMFLLAPLLLFVPAAQAVLYARKT